MKNAALSGKPYAGNPHVRFDEGEVASAKPRRGSLLYKKIVVMAAFFAVCSAVAETISVGQKETKTNDTFLVVDNDVAVHGDLTITGSKVWVSADKNGRSFNLGTWSNDRAKTTVTGGARIGPGSPDRNNQYFTLYVGNANNGTGWLDVYNTEGGSYIGWSTNSYNAIFSEIYVNSGTPTNDTGYIDFLRINGDANCIVGIRKGIYNNASDPARIRFNGGKFGPYNSVTLCRKGDWVFESVGGNEIFLYSWWGHTTMLEGTARLTFQGEGGVTLSGSKEANANGYFYTLSTNINWNQSGDVKFTTEMGVKLANDYALSKIHRDGKRVIFSKATAQIDLNGKRETLNGFTSADFTAGKVRLRDTGTTKGRFLIGSDDPDKPFDFGLISCFDLEPTCLPILKNGSQDGVLPESAVRDQLGVEWGAGRLTVSNGYHWVRINKWASDCSYCPEGVRDLAPAFCDNMGLLGGELDVRRGALVVSNLSLSADVAVHVRTNSAIRLQAKEARSEKFIRFLFKEARNPTCWIHLRSLHLRALDGTELFFNTGFTRNAEATSATDLEEGEFMFHEGAKWIDGLAVDMNGKEFNTNYKCNDIRFSQTADWGGLCLTNSIPKRGEPETWDVITIRLKAASKPVAGYHIYSNWTFPYFPSCWEVQVSSDGTAWTTVDERTDYYPYAYSNHNPGTDELGGTYEGYLAFNGTGKDHAFRWTKDVNPDLVNLSLNGAKVRIDAGGVLDASQTDGASEVAALEVDASVGLGIFRNVAFAENGTINVIAASPLKGTTVLPMTLEDCTGAANLASWSVSVNGVRDDVATVAFADGKLILKTNRGAILLVR